ncbi:MAG: hypothetical protein M0R38_12760 [Bacteroidia bacterium]|nr:hypothetical protein [Bacteroidia bacterium]
MESILDKKYSRYKIEAAVTEKRVIAIKVKVDRSVKVGMMWAPEVVDFYKEVYPDIIEEGFSLSELEYISNFEELYEGFGD